MLERIGAGDLGDLFEDVPPDLRANASLDLPPALGEQALLSYIETRASRNVPATQIASFLGAGAYHHFIPAAGRLPGQPRRVLDRLHALPGGDQPGHAAGDLRVPVG